MQKRIVQPTNSKHGARRATSGQLASAQADRLLNFRQVNELIGSSCKTGHTARSLAKRGQIRGVYINDRTIRYSENSVRDLIAGRVAPAGPVAPAAKLTDEVAAS